ncbi:hypothetical protein LQF12_02185 [Ruania suaedae]|uniref:hypothetical protein n=1 Tax=Ruania suaedae TaxID=2897774 RepID=UPI001E42C871|nr:hypothetical protein [Ruania suaedae]UFU03441.1 hypothetical protein LQF12_02185 [Ruania suaedae]
MEMIVPADLSGVDDAVARRLIVVARSIAPCLDTLEGEARLDAIAILQGVAAELPAPGTGRMRQQSRNGTSVSWADYRSAFGPDDRTGLLALCGARAGGGPVGSFPPSTMTRSIWPPEATA